MKPPFFIAGLIDETAQCGGFIIEVCRLALSRVGEREFDACID